MKSQTFYDNTPFEYGYASKEEIIANMNPILRSLMERNAGKIFCDIGCGCGRNLVYAVRYASKVVGVDMSKSSLDFANNFVQSENLKLVEGNNLELPLASNFADVVVSDGVCHHTGDTVKAFSECIRILKPNGNLYLAVYKKFRYYPLVYYFIGGFFRLLDKSKVGRYIVEYLFVNLHCLMYRIFKRQKLSKRETRNIFFDYFITPIATFQSYNDVKSWCNDYNCRIECYAKTSGNCHAFIINKNEKEF
ncbi:MAG: class I SAM-dependent methyltransferase [Bacteroidota bacterium]|nr:class I SAM-dependent methyltransferase [Bacteroidota bacterium]